MKKFQAKNSNAEKTFLCTSSGKSHLLCVEQSSKVINQKLADLTIPIEKNQVTAAGCGNCKSKCGRQIILHDIQLQLCDSFGFPVVAATENSVCAGGTDTSFWVTLEIIKDGPLVTINFPTINFQTGQVSVNNPYCPFGEELPGFPPPGGYLYTADGFLPEELRPNDLVPRSIIAASNNGLSPVFSFTQTATSLPQPPIGYLVQVTNAGAIQVQCAGTFGNIIPPGPQILMPCSITYVVKSKKKLCKNFTISDGLTNVTQFTNPNLLNDALRDLHIQDAFDGKVVFTWADNSMVTDKTNGTMNCMVAVGKVNKDGILVVDKPVQLTDFPAEIQSWSSAVAIDRANPDIIVVSYALIDVGGIRLFPPCRAVSTDGGKTWPEINTYIAGIGSITDTRLTVSQMVAGTLEVGQTIMSTVGDIAAGTTIISQISNNSFEVNISQNVPGDTAFIASPPLNGAITICTPVSRGFGDCRGVSSDKFGNIWYSTTNFFDELGNLINQPIFAVSTDGGIDFTVTYTAPLPDLPLGTFALDNPTYCFGGDGLGNYGLWFQYSLLNFVTGDTTTFVGFIIINGLNDFGSVTQTALPQFMGALGHVDITASTDGRLWGQGPSDDWFSLPFSYVQPGGLMFKSPGSIDENYAGPWQWITYNDIVWNWGITNIISSPSNGYKFKTSPQSIIFDEEKDALYAIIAVQTPDYSQDMPVYFVISRDNGMTWSNPLDIRSNNLGNSGYQSMALDPITGDLVLGWYDGRNDPSYQSLEYMAAIIPAVKLQALVDAIPSSNPTFEVPSEAA